MSWVCILLAMDNDCLLTFYTFTCFFILSLSVITGSAFVLVFLPHGTFYFPVSDTSRESTLSSKFKNPTDERLSLF